MQKLALLAGLCLIAAQPGSTARLVCQYASHSDLRDGTSQFHIADIDGDLCTHLIYSSVCIDSLFNISATATQLQNFGAFTALSGPKLKKILDVNLMVEKAIVQNMMATSANRDAFIMSAVSFLRTHQFDGINILWVNENKQDNKALYTSLIEEFRVKMDAESLASGKAALLLTASVAAQIPAIEWSYEVPQIAAAVDFLNVRTSDVDFPTATPSFSTPTASFNMAATSMQYWEFKGAPAAKLNMGIGVFGEVFTVDARGNVEPLKGSLSDVPPGLWARYEVCSLLGRSAAPHLWIAFDNKAAIDAKVNYIVNNSYGGAFVMSVDLDDFNGNSCNNANDLNGPYPVITHLHKQLAN
ncbi:acidic mammalian chitinase-like [Phyllopteryx taeniolatus]|uniref:acidic mammalian chitinase-like n=1 Tax=Phyllopteryx taeniolatus TaxID=161469 RepID=UPI002AD54DAB|nr:acidic mammalian chitinase-like [Phyllopteryx taeniolatus]